MVPDDPDQVDVRPSTLVFERDKMFGDLEVPVERFESPEEVWLRAPPHPVALLDVTLREGAQEVFIPQAFTYFDPVSRYGGVWGEPIAGAVKPCWC